MNTKHFTISLNLFSKTSGWENKQITVVTVYTFFLSLLPVGVLFGTVAAEAEVEVLADIAVNPAAYDETLAVITSILHVHHLMIVLVSFRLSAT